VRIPRRPSYRSYGYRDSSIICNILKDQSSKNCCWKLTHEQNTGCGDVKPTALPSPEPNAVNEGEDGDECSGQNQLTKEDSVNLLDKAATNLIMEKILNYYSNAKTTFKLEDFLSSLFVHKSKAISYRVCDGFR